MFVYYKLYRKPVSPTISTPKCPSLAPLTDLFANPRTVASAVLQQQRDQSPREREPECALCKSTPGGIGVSAREAHRSTHSQRP